MLTNVFTARLRCFLAVSFVVLGWISCVGSSLGQSAVISVDVYNQKIHVERGSQVKRPVGALTKVATALVALDWAEATKVPLSTLVTVTPAAVQIAGQNTLGLQPGDQMTVRDLMYASMMTSDNVAATSLALFVGRDILQRRGKRGDALGEFVGEMNKLAAREFMYNTKFTNPHGLENSKTMPYSTGVDMARLALYAVSRAPFRFYTNQKSREVTVVRQGQPYKLTLTNTNRVLSVGNVDGMKTGQTARSGSCAIISEERPGTSVKGADGRMTVYRHRMVVVVLGSSDANQESAALLRQSWGVYDQWLQAGRPVTDPRQTLSGIGR